LTKTFFVLNQIYEIEHSMRRPFAAGRLGAIPLGLILLASVGCHSSSSSPADHTSMDVGLRCGAESRPTARDPEEIPFRLSETHTGTGPMRIVTTVGMVTDIVRQVAGDRAEVTGLMKEGVDPHLYQPTRDDLKKLQQADAVFYCGLHLETSAMQSLFTQQAKSGRPVFAVTDGISRSYLHSPPEFAGHYDPHVWGDIAAWSLAVNYVAQALSAYDPPGAESYASNAKAYQKQLAELEEYALKAIRSIPEEQRVLITAHDAFGYFSCAYQIPVKSAQGISTESEAGVNDVNRLVDLIVARKIQAIFVESSVNQKNMLAITEGANRRGQNVSIGGELFSDAMGPAGTYEGTYLGMMDHNITTIALALGGEAPKRGLHGKLQRD
jgi:manganese/zinc/iron transport system substrate-binding protein